jgi:hypothetical protein
VFTPNFREKQFDFSQEYYPNMQVITFLSILNASNVAVCIITQLYEMG